MLRGLQCEGEELVDGNQFTASSPAAAVASTGHTSLSLVIMCCISSKMFLAHPEITPLLDSNNVRTVLSQR